MKSDWNNFLGASFVAGCLSWGVAAGTAQTNGPAGAPPIPPIPVMRSPVDAFRSLLLMPASERAQQLASRPSEIGKKLAAKIREYQALAPEERELRLKATELRWYLKPLMALSPTNRAERLQLIPDSMREMVRVRLEQWDRLAPVVQQMMRTNEYGATYLVAPPANLYPPLPGVQVRRKMQERFEQFFQLTDAEKEKVVVTLSEAEQLQMQKTLDAYQKLNPGQRGQCLRSFAKFSGMSPTERREFLENAARWSQMTPTERQAWRDLVSAAPKVPPLPQLRIPPPIPPGLRRTPLVPTTNGG